MEKGGEKYFSPFLLQDLYTLNYLINEKKNAMCKILQYSANK